MSFKELVMEYEDFVVWRFWNCPYCNGDNIFPIPNLLTIKIENQTLICYHCKIEMVASGEFLLGSNFIDFSKTKAIRYTDTVLDCSHCRYHDNIYGICCHDDILEKMNPEKVKQYEPIMFEKWNGNGGTPSWCPLRSKKENKHTTVDIDRYFVDDGYIVCPNCDASVKSEDHYCWNCGKSFNWIGNYDESNNNQNEKEDQ